MPSPTGPPVLVSTQGAARRQWALDAASFALGRRAYFASWSKKFPDTGPACVRGSSGLPGLPQCGDIFGIKLWPAFESGGASN